MAITTKKGDNGTTTFLNQTIDKDDILMELIGTIDEVSAWFVYLRSITNQSYRETLVQDLSVLAGYLTGFCSDFEQERLLNLEKELSSDQNLSSFQYPFENPVKAQINIVRTVVRRLERCYCRYTKEYESNEIIFKYLNRLSDVIFIKM